MRGHPFWLVLLLVSKLALGTEADFNHLLEQGRLYLREGHYNLALKPLKNSQEYASTTQQRAQSAGLLGQTYYRMHKLQEAEASLRQAIALDQESGLDRARWLSALANLLAEQGQRDEANSLYTQALKLAQQDPGLQIGIRLGQHKITAKKSSLAELINIHANIIDISKPEERAVLLINLAGQASSLGSDGLKLAYESYQQASFDAAKNPRLLTEALAGMAGLYESQKRIEEALRINSHAIESAQAVDAHDLLLELHWRQARLHKALNHKQEALAAYRKSVESIEIIREDIPVQYQNGRSSFRETLEPVYLGLADLLLEQAKGQSGNDKTQSLRQARDTVERIKQSELEDFLGGRCALHTINKHLENIESHTAVIYPVILPDRLELLVSVGAEVGQFTQAVDSTRLQTAATQLAKALRKNKKDAQTLAEPLYQWMIAPLDAWLRQRQVDTLVIVPDGVLRLVPFAALYDGKRFLVERYNIATAPGLSLLEPINKPVADSKSLLAGISELGPVVERLPPSFLIAMLDATKRGSDEDSLPRSRALPFSPIEAGETLSESQLVELKIMRGNQAKLQSIKRQYSLPGVADEMDKLSQQMPNTLLKNEDFTVVRFTQSLAKESYSRVHIASHGVFGSTAKTSFILAFDDIITMDDLEKLLKTGKPAQSPLDLLTLSACQTAEGDDRAPLGFSGIAIKAKAGSALGTLWSVNDEAASKLMTEFYQALAQPRTGKAQALRQAQLALLKDPSYAHPYYWAAFVLVGNWL